MIKNSDIQRLIQRGANGRQVLSLYLDMSVNSENKRKHHVFLQQKRNEHSELDSDRDGHHREPLGAAFERIEKWIEENYDQANHGLAIFLEIGGDWMDAIQLPGTVANRFVISDQPVIGPLAEIISKNPHYGIALLDRENCRLLSYFLGELRQHKEIHPEVYPTPHDVQKGGQAQKNYQKHKAEETRQSFKQFAQEMGELDRRFDFDHWILLGTDENVKNFRAFLPPGIEERVVCTNHASVDASETDIVERLKPFFTEHSLQDEASTIDVLRDRLRQRHFAIGGVRNTLEQLQEGKVDTLVIARDLDSHGAQCTKCGFYLDARSGNCPYCGGELRDGVDLVESMIRMAAQQEVALEFVDPSPLSEHDGVAALLKF